MAWTAPRTWVAGEIVTAALMNTHIRDNERYLKGLDGVPTIESGLVVDNTDGDEYIKLPLLSNAECITALNVEGELTYSEDAHQIWFHNGSAIKVIVSTADVDDTPVNGETTYPISSNWAYDLLYLLSGTGDIIYSTAAGTWSRLAIGTVGQVLRVNAGATAPEWAASIATKQFFVPCYVGNGGAAQAFGDFWGYVLGVADYAAMSFRLPNDFASLTSAKVSMIPIGTGTFDWTTTTDFGASGEAYTANSDSATADGQACTNNQLLELDISAAFTGVAANDLIGLLFTCDALATATGLLIIGVDIKYV